MIQRSKPIRRTAIKRSTKPIARSKPKAKRAKPRPGRLTGTALEELRVECFMRDKGVCQGCGCRTVFGMDQECDESFHMAHRRGKRMWGDHIDQVDTQCGKCHRLEHSYGKDRIKPCPPKPKP